MGEWLELTPSTQGKFYFTQEKILLGVFLLVK